MEETEMQVCGKHVVGIVSLGDLAARAKESSLVGAATEGICQPCS